eukprot:756216-Prorocentrum_minimum.AAC.1
MHPEGVRRGSGGQRGKASLMQSARNTSGGGPAGFPGGFLPAPAGARRVRRARSAARARRWQSPQRAPPPRPPRAPPARATRRGARGTARRPPCALPCAPQRAARARR